MGTGSTLESQLGKINRHRTGILPAVELLRVFLSHQVEPVSYRCILQGGIEIREHRLSDSLKQNWNLSFAYLCVLLQAVCAPAWILDKRSDSKSNNVAEHKLRPRAREHQPYVCPDMTQTYPPTRLLANR